MTQGSKTVKFIENTHFELWALSWIDNQIDGVKESHSLIEIAKLTLLLPLRYSLFFITHACEGIGKVNNKRSYIIYSSDLWLKRRLAFPEYIISVFFSSSKIEKCIIRCSNLVSLHFFNQPVKNTGKQAVVLIM